ncbi:ubiquinone oxidoreductase B8 subunit [Gracilaria domingensis]|nr:ubiquinone oxidoreductase B8 subunit [Gracilaria domingensis]
MLTECGLLLDPIRDREFLKNHYADLKALNPGLPIYARPADGVEPHIAARYARGVYDVKRTSNLTADQILGIVKEFEAAATVVNSRVGSGIGGDIFKLADVV